MSDLKSRLIASAKAWADAHGCGLSRLGKRVAGDANFFVRLEAEEATCNLATLEKFARFLAEAENWPDGAVPAAVSAFVHVTGVRPPLAPPSPGNAPAASPAAPIRDVANRVGASRVDAA